MVAHRALPKLAPAPRWRGRTVDEHAEAVVAVCRAAAAIVESQPDGRKHLSSAERVPDSTRAHG
jgi:hypothetical protein